VMTSASSDEGASIATAHDFSGYRRIVDVGGGHGALLAAVLDRYSGPLGVLFDLPDVVETARGAIDRHIVAGRVEKVAGDFSEAVPPGGDAYLLKWIDPGHRLPLLTSSPLTTHALAACRAPRDRA
jgi:tRNA A58 N-methylase Trm61